MQNVVQPNSIGLQYQNEKKLGAKRFDMRAPAETRRKNQDDHTKFMELKTIPQVGQHQVNRFRKIWKEQRDEDAEK